MALLGIDLGTSSVKVLVLDTQGHTLSVGRADYNVLTPQSGWAEGSPEEWWAAVITATHVAMEKASSPPINAIGLSGQMHGVVLANERGQPTRAAVLWPDTRAATVLAGYRTMPTSTLRRLANPLVPGMAGPILSWLSEHDQASYQEARWALQPKDWLRFRLTGTAATDPSDASATLLYDLPADCWADDIIAKLALRRELFAPILPSASCAGTLSATAAEALGLPQGIPVATGAGDTAAAILGSGFSTLDAIQLTLGTGAQLVQLTSQLCIDETGRTHLYRSADSSQWYIMAAVQNGGLALNWVRQMVQASWEELYASANAVAPGAEGLLFLPYLTRERAHQRNAHGGGAFLGLRIDHQRVHLLHAALEGVAFGIRTALEALPAASSVTELCLVGGGSIHPAWRQMLATILKRELVSIETTDASARGAALLAGIAGGIWANTASIVALAPQCQLVAVSDKSQGTVYDELYARYLSLSNSSNTHELSR